MKKLVLLICMLAMLMLGCGGTKSNSDKLQVVASFYPMAEFTKGVGGEFVDLHIMVPDGVEPHDWEPTPRDLVKLGKAKLFVYNGHVESWAQNALNTLNDRPITAVETGKDLYDIAGHRDPHVWVSPKKAILQTERIMRSLCKADPRHAEAYEKQGKEYLAKLHKLDENLNKIASEAPHKKFITAHAAFGHLAADYGLEQIPVAGISPEAEPSPGYMKNLVQMVRREKVKYIFMETLANPKLTEVIAKETGAKILVLDPIEGLDEEGRKNKLNYLKIMEKNIENLQKALYE